MYAFIFKKILHELPAGILADAADDLWAVIQPVVLRKMIQGAGSSPFGILCTENKCRYPGMNDSTHAHYTRFDSNI